MRVEEEGIVVYEIDNCKNVQIKCKALKTTVVEFTE